MNFKRLIFKDVVLINPCIYKDNRGFFFENIRINKLNKFLKKKTKFVQENISISKKNVFRGLHFQSKPYEQSKLITVLNGSILDIVVNLKKNSRFYKKKIIVKLDTSQHSSLFIPKGYAHGFLTLENNTIVKYSVDNYYNKNSEKCLDYKDKVLNLERLISSKIVISDKDKMGKLFSELEFNL
jgi:dTDP-4-dehydrorhamnose 3,5-epimerase